MQENVAQEIKDALKDLSTLKSILNVFDHTKKAATEHSYERVFKGLAFTVVKLDVHDINLLNQIGYQKIWKDGPLGVDVKRSGTGLTVIVTQ